VTNENGELLPGKEYCPNDQGDERCRKIAAKDCVSFEPHLIGVDLQLIRIKESLK
jgi:hypothetical protein